MFEKRVPKSKDAQWRTERKFAEKKNSETRLDQKPFAENFPKIF